MRSKARDDLDLATDRALLVVGIFSGHDFDLVTDLALLVIGVIFGIREVRYVVEESDTLVVLDDEKAENAWGCARVEALGARGWGPVRGEKFD